MNFVLNKISFLNNLKFMINQNLTKICEKDFAHPMHSTEIYNSYYAFLL